tara:strand:+ start:2445 stop:3356 length:912 start_codon:yes stop_codon:yes gene_type:complete
LKKKTIIHITGPTASGKTDLSIKLSQIFNTDIVSYDSRQFYKQMKIGTSVPNSKQLKKVKHYFIHNKNITDNYNVGIYRSEANEIINKLFQNKNFLVFVGGSGLYGDSIIFGLDNFPEVPKKIRDNLTKELKQKGIEFLQEKLKKADKEYYKRVDIYNHRRLIRALEVIETTGKKFSSFHRLKKSNENFNLITLNIDFEKNVLHKRIENRVDKMIYNGLENEVFKLKKFKKLNPMKSVGYYEWFDYWEKKINFEDVVNKIKNNTKKYAKKQKTWNKKYDNAILCSNESNLDELVYLIKKKFKH